VSFNALPLPFHTLQDTLRALTREWTQLTKNGPQVTSRVPREIAILCYPGAQATCVHGLTDLFTYADYFARAHAARSPAGTPGPAGPGDQPFLRVTHWRERPGSAEFECGFASYPGTSGNFELVIVPAYQLGPPEPNHSPIAAAWVARKHADGTAVASVCGGVFLLAESGLLDGRRVTTHWKFAAELRRRFPDLYIDADRLVIDEHDIVTAGGVLAWIDLGLTLVERLLGRTVMVSTARFMLVDPPGREQRFYDEFAPPLQHGDKAVLAIQRWLQADTGTACSVDALAKRAGLGTRTFLRRFFKATGMTPGEYRQRLRIARSRELLEYTSDTVAQVALAVGYEDTRGFRRTFKRVIGLPPAEYRRRFQHHGT
jgi:transcriptional regulator GlxA family with amidase domain